WEELRPHGNDVPWFHTVWLSYAIPRHAFQLWLVMRRALKTQDKLRIWDVDPTTDLSQLRCSLCGLVTDMHKHLFFECSYSSKVWRLVRGLAGMDPIQLVLEDVVNWFQPMDAKRTVLNVVGKLLFAASVYFIWIDRNQRLLKNKRRTPEELRDAIVITEKTLLKSRVTRLKDLKTGILQSIKTLLEEVRPVLETMAYHEKYKKVLDEILKDKVELDGMIVKEVEEAIKKVKGEALKEKDDPRAFIFPIRLDGQVNENALADTGSVTNTMPYRIYEQLGREEMKKVDIGITMINHTQAEAMGILTNVLCEVGVTTLIDKFLILDIPIDCDAPIVVGRGFLRTIGGITIGGNDVESGSSRSKRSRKFETVKEVLLSKVHHEFLLWGGCNNEAQSRYNTKLANLLPRHIYSPCVVNWDVLNGMGCDREIDDMLRIRLREAESNEEIFTSVAWIRAFNIKEPIYAELCHEFYSTYEFDEVCADDVLQSKKIIKFRLGGRAHNLTLLEFAHRLGLYHADELEEDGFDVYFQGGMRSDEHFNAQEYWLSISREDNLGLLRSHTSTIRSPILRVIHKMITYGICQRTTRYANVAWLIARWIKRKGVGTQKENQICCGKFIMKIARKMRVLTDAVLRSLSALIYCRDLDTTTLRELIDFEGRLIPEDPRPGVPRVGIPRPPRASMQDLYDRMGSMEIR
ncbi:retrotransposon ORF1, partial [Tanacetum coccineum]